MWTLFFMELIWKVINVMAAIGGAIGLIMYGVKAKRFLRKSQLEAKERERELTEYYESLGMETDPQKKQELHTAISLKMMLSDKYQRYLLHISSMMGRMPIILFLMAVLAEEGPERTLLYSTAVAILTAYAGMEFMINRAFERGVLKYESYIKPIQENLLSEKFR